MKLNEIRKMQKLENANLKVTFLSLVLHFSYSIGFIRYNFFTRGDKLHATWSLIRFQWKKPRF